MSQRSRERATAGLRREKPRQQAKLLSALRTQAGTRLPKVFLVGPGPGQLGGISSVMSYLQAQAQGRGSYDLQFVETMKDGRWSLVSFASAVTRLSFAMVKCRLLGQAVVVHLNVSVRGSTYRKWFVAQICRMFATPYVVHLHGGRYRTFFFGSRPVVQRAIFALFQKSSRLIVLGSAWRQFAIEHLHVDGANVVVIPNGTPELPESFRRPTERVEGNLVRIVFSGRLDEKKGLTDLLAAADILYMETQDFEIVLLGDSRDPSLLRAVESRPYCHVKGWLPHDEVVEQLSGADIFTLPSHDEGLPMAMLEAMSLGLPLVVTAVGAIPDVVVDGQEGYLIEPRDIDRLYESLKQLVSNKYLRDRMGQAAYDKWQDALGAERMTQRIFSQWEAALAASRGRSDQ